MLAKQLSPWTLAWFGMALLFLLAALSLGLMGIAGPGNWAGGTGLAIVHLFALGWLGLAMLGALIQFSPVLTARPPVLGRLALPALLATTGGTLALAGGFLWLDGQEGAQGIFLVAPWMLATGFALVMAMILPPLCAPSSLRLAEVRMVLLGLVALVGLWGSGTAMVLALSGVAAPGFLPDGLPLHAALGLGGWMSFAAFGVSYKLFAMFLLAPEQGGALRNAVLIGAGIALTILLAGVVPLAFGYAVSDRLTASLIILVPLVAGLYLAEAARIWRARRRPQMEANMRWSRVALVFLMISGLLAAAGLAWGGVWAEAAVFAALTGWLSLLTLAQMIKITSFLTWLQVFAPRIGRGPVPLVQDLTRERTVGRLLALWSVGVAGGTVALLLSLPLVFRLSVAALFLAALGLIWELLAIRRLSNLEPRQRPTRLPHAILPIQSAEFLS